MPTVEIIIPVYNRVTLVHEAIASALEAANEVSVAVIVVDDGSTDGTWESLGAYDGNPAVRCLRVPVNGGQSAGRNLGLDAATATYVKFLDSDDVLTPGHLALEVGALESTGADIAVSGWLSEGGGWTASFEAPVFHDIIDDVLAGIAVPTSAALYVRHPEWRWDPALRKLDDWDYFCQAALRARIIVTVEGSAYTMREHSGPRESATTMLANAHGHHRILFKIEEHLAETGELTPPRRRRLAQYFYKEMRVLSLHDRDAFDAGAIHIRELDPHFQPRDEEQQQVMRVLARFVGFRNAILLHSAIKRALKRDRR
jgi:glycosyltransferase involved in cell wall biosynthesis